MKKTHELKNGTVLEEGAKYTSNHWQKHDHITVLSLGGNTLYYKTSAGKEDVKTYGYAYTNWELIPYTEPETLYQFALKTVEDSWHVSPELYTEDGIKDEYPNMAIYQKLKAYQEINGFLVRVELREDEPKAIINKI